MIDHKWVEHLNATGVELCIHCGSFATDAEASSPCPRRHRVTLRSERDLSSPTEKAPPATRAARSVTKKPTKPESSLGLQFASKT